MERDTFRSLGETVINSDAVKANNMTEKTNYRAFPDRVKDATLYRAESRHRNDDNF